MLLNEANTWLEKPITEEELDSIHMIYCLLDLSKEQFCKIVDAIGVEALADKKEHYYRLHTGEQLLKSKENHEKKKKEVAELDARMKQLEEQRKEAIATVAAYEQAQENSWIKK